MEGNSDKPDADRLVEAGLERANLKDQSIRLLNSSEYAAAKISYGKLLQLQNKPLDQLQTLLSIASCDEKLGEPQEGAVERITATVELCNMSGNDVMAMAKQHKNSASVILYLCACKVFRDQIDPTEAVELIRRCFRECKDVIKSMASTLGPAVAVKWIPLMRRMLEYLREIKDVDAKVKAFNEAECLNSLGIVYHYCQRYQDAVSCYTAGIGLMISHYGSAASKYNVYAVLLNNRGAANENQNNYVDSVKDYKRSIDARREAEDVDADFKKKWIGLSESGLRRSLTSLARTDPEMAKRLEEELQGKGEAEKIDPDNEARSPEKTMGKALGSVTADSGIGTFQSKSSATTSVKTRARTMKFKTVKGSLPEDSFDEGVSMSSKKQNSAYDLAALKLQKQEMKKLGLIRDHRKDRMNRWKVVQDLGLIRNHRKDRINRWKVVQVMEEVDLGEEDSPEQTFSINKLLMSGFCPSIDTLEIFSAHLQDIELQVEEIDLSNNFSLEEDHIQYVGDIIRHSKVKSLILQNCGLNPGLLLGLKKSLNATMLTKLDVSHNPHIGPDGMTFLGKDIVRMCKVQSLSLRSCGLTAQHMIKLKESLANVKLRKLDVSENSQLSPDGMSHLGNIVRLSEVKTLLLRECMFSQAHIRAMKQSLDGYKMMELDLGRKDAPVWALSWLDSQSSATSDEGSSDNDGSEDDEDDSVPKSSVTPLEKTTGKLEESTLESGVKEPMSENFSDGRTPEEELVVSVGKQQSVFTVKDLILDLLPTVKSYLRMNNWEIENEAQKVLLKKMREKELHGLQITYGRRKASGFATLSIRKKVEFQRPLKDFKANAPTSSATDGEDLLDDEELPSVDEDELEFTVERSGSAEEDEFHGTSGWSSEMKPLQVTDEPPEAESVEEHRGMQPERGDAHCSIGPDGGEITLEGFTIKFPPGAVEGKNDFHFQTSLDIPPPKNVTFISPVLICEPDGFQFKKDITITAPCWCRTIDPEKLVEVQIYSKPSGKYDWDLAKTKPLGQNYKITFTCDHFSEDGIGVETSDENQSNIACLLEYLLFANNELILYSGICSVNDTVKRNLISERQKLNLVPIFPGGDQIEVEPKTEITVGLQSKDSQVDPTEFQKFVVTNAFREKGGVSRVFSHTILQPPPQNKKVILKLIVHDRNQLVVWPTVRKTDQRLDLSQKSEAHTDGNSQGSLPTRKPINMNGFLYGLADQINESVWLRFARTMLDLPNPDVDRIDADERHSTEEKKFQMLLLWTKKNKGTERELQERLLQLKEEFFAPREESRPGDRNPNTQATGLTRSAAVKRESYSGDPASSTRSVTKKRKIFKESQSSSSGKRSSSKRPR